MCTPSAAATVTAVLHALSVGERPPPGFNSAWLAIRPKVLEESHTKQTATRRARALRPLALKNTDAKSVASAVSRTTRKTATAQAHSAQRGLVARRLALVQIWAISVEFRANVMLSQKTFAVLRGHNMSAQEWHRVAWAALLPGHRAV